MDVKRRLVPDMWDVAMNATTPVMSNPALWAAAAQGVRATRAIGRDGRIGALPFPASLWTRTRDLPVAPEESLRQWWRRTHPDGITPAATVEAAHRALKNQEEK